MHCFCHACATCQEIRELKGRGGLKGGDANSAAVPLQVKTQSAEHSAPINYGGNSAPASPNKPQEYERIIHPVQQTLHTNSASGAPPPTYGFSPPPQPPAQYGFTPPQPQQPTMNYGYTPPPPAPPAQPYTTNPYVKPPMAQSEMYPPAALPAQNSQYPPM